MTRSRRLAAIEDHFNRQAREAARLLAEVQSRLTATEATLKKLLDYRREYAGRPHAAPGTRPWTAAAMRNLRAFLGRLDQSIGEQTDRIEELRLELQQRRERWLSRYGEARALEAVIERLRSEERRQQHRREQADLDEASARMGRHGG